MKRSDANESRLFFLATLSLITVPSLIAWFRKKQRSVKMSITDIVEPREPHKMPLVSEKGWEQYKNRFQPDPNDIIICTAGKTGTTWLQAICHFLRGGSADFDDIGQVAPWHILAYDLDYDIMDQHGLRPRVFKSHQLIAAEKRGCKYITTIRDPVRKVMSDVSFFNEKRGTNETVDESWKRQDEKISQHFQGTLMHFAEAYQLRDHPQVLVVSYEHLIKDTRRLLRTIALFLGIQDPSDELLERTLKATSKEQMLIDVSKYNESWATRRYNELGRGTLASRGEKWNPGAKVVGVAHKKPSKETRNAIMSRANDYLYQTVGVRNYEELQEHIGAAFSKKTKELELGI